MTAAPGWHPDPWGSGRLRWWDGVAWSPHLSAMVGEGLYDPVTVQKRARWARLGLAVVVPVQLLSGALSGIGLRRAFEDLRLTLEALDSTPEGTTPFVRAPTGGAYAPLGQLVGMGTFVVAILFLVWAHAAARQAQRLGVPAKRSPGWAVGGWFIPIGNLWLPLRSVLDMVPPGDPLQRRIRRWWALYLVGSVLVSLAGFAFLIGDLEGVAALLLAGVPLLAAALAARQVVDDVQAVHERIAGQRGLAPPMR